jgi:A/G-specific adenine glycosylase
MINNQLSTKSIEELQQSLLSWFYPNQRYFPWRESRNPYHILIAEKLLQQTSVGERVINAYISIINKYPDIKGLSNADITNLASYIMPLGLVYRAKELVHLANVIMDKYSGKIPNNYKLLIQLPGIGEYSGRAILSFAFGMDIAIVDTNVSRILFHLFWNRFAYTIKSSA